MITYRCNLPVPPSNNNLFANGKNGGRFPTKAYRKWKTEAEALELTFPAGFPPEQCWGICIDLGPFRRKGYRRGRDVDNGTKAIVDLICKYTGLTDDYLDVLIVKRSWGPMAPPEGMATVNIWTMEAGDGDLREEAGGPQVRPGARPAAHRDDADRGRATGTPAGPVDQRHHALPAGSGDQPASQRRAGAAGATRPDRAEDRSVAVGQWPAERTAAGQRGGAARGPRVDEDR